MATLTGKPTYLSAPNCDFAPNDIIALGSLITDPWKPQNRLNKASIIPIPTSDIKTSFQEDWHTTSADGRKHKLAIWTSFVQMITGVGGDISASVDTQRISDYRFDRLETSFFFPDVEYIAKSLREPSVQRYIRASLLKKPVYMISGVKIARGASLSRSKASEQGVSSKIGVDGTALGIPVSLGPEINLLRKQEQTVSFGRSSDFVFAYRIVKIVSKRDGSLKTREYDKGALYDLEDSAKPTDQKHNANEWNSSNLTSSGLEQGYNITLVDEEDEACAFLRS